MDIPKAIHDRLLAIGQEHLVRFWSELDEHQRRQLVLDLDEVDFDLVHRLLTSPDAVAAGVDPQRVARAQSPENLVRQPRTDSERSEWRRAAEIGQRVLKEGRVGAILVAGGQGTRLGFDKPKGMFPIGPVSQTTLYQWFAEQLVGRTRQFGPRIPYFIMTSDATHDETVAFFKQNDFFGLTSDDVFFFQQGTLPAAEGDVPRLLLDEKHRLSVSPDGHGGILKALERHRLLDEMVTRGIDLLYYHQVDNPTADFCDPAFLGWHVLRHSEVSTKVVAKVAPEERMGVVCSIDGRTEIIEYSDLTPEQSRITNADGALRFWAGNTAMHVFSRSFLSRLAEERHDLPYHVAKKAVPFINDEGQKATSQSPNARKFEQFIFDTLPLAENALVVEADRRLEFNPVKNREGADSPATSRAALVQKHRSWIESAGGTVNEGVTVEISPLFALDEEQARSRIRHGSVFARDVVLDATHLGEHAS